MSSQSNANASPEGSGLDTVFDPRPDALGGTGRALVPGTMLEEYEIQRVLSESGFAVVYLAMDHAFDRLVVIKEYQPSTLAEHSETSRAELRGPAHATAFKRGKYAFMSESRMLASCDHPSLLRVNRIWDANGTVYRVMPYYFGKSLQLTRQAAPQAPDEASLRLLLDGLLGALATLHEQDCVHGAVSPDNILLLADDRPVLLDFGAVRRAIVSPETQRLIAMLEPSYLPMEQIEPAPPELVPGPWSDLYAVAAVLYFCIAGELPKRARREPIAAYVRKLQQRQPGLEYSPALLYAIDAALAENPHERPQSVAEFRQLLDTPRAVTELAGGESETDAAAASSPAASASDDFVNVQGRVVPFTRRKEAAFRAPVSTPVRRPGGRSVGAAGADATAASDEGAPSRFYPTLEEMMAESDERVVADMRRERAKVQFPESAPIRPEERQPKSRRVAGVAAGLVLMAALGLGGWKLNEQRKADEMLGSLGAAASASVPVPAAAEATPMPAPLPAPTSASPRVAAAPTVPPRAAESPRTAAPANSRHASPGPAPAPPEPPPLVDMREPSSPPAQVAVKPLPAAGEIPLSPPPGAGRSSGANQPPLGSTPDALVKPPKEPSTPRDACGDRVDFALYNCMQTQCARGRWSSHAQCRRLRDTDEVIP